MKKCKSMIGLLLIGVIVVLGGNALAKNDDTYKKIIELKNEIIQLQNSGELGVRNFTLCSRIYDITSYVPLLGRKIEEDGTFSAYYEPANLYTRVSEGRYEFWFTQDILIIDKKGKKWVDQKELINYHRVTFAPVLDLYATNKISLISIGSPPPGKYIYTITLNDLFRNKSITKSIEFEVVKKAES